MNYTLRFILFLIAPFAVANLAQSEIAIPENPLPRTESSLFEFSKPQNMPDLDDVLWISQMGSSNGVISLLALASSPEGLGLYQWNSHWNTWQLQKDGLQALESSVATTSSRGIITINQSTEESTVTHWKTDPTDGQLIFETLPELEQGYKWKTAAVLGDILYIGGIAEAADPTLSNVYLAHINITRSSSDWQKLEVGPIVNSQAMLLLAQHNSLYLFSRTAESPSVEVAVYNTLRGWQARRQAPVDITSSTATMCGDSHIIFVGSNYDPNSLIGYHTITDAWSHMGSSPAADKVFATIQTDDVQFKIVTKDKIHHIRAILQSTNYGWPDHLVLASFMAMMIGVGVYLSRRERTKKDFFRGGRKIPFWASGLSLFATGASGISLMAMPGRAFEDNWAYLTISFFIIATYPLVFFVYIPIARRLNVATANEYLERRFNLLLRLFGSVVYSINQILARLAAIMLLPAIAISAIAGIPMETSILIMGLVTTLYATLGGLEGVIWTDVIQAIVMLLAVFICAIWALVALQADPATAFNAIQSAEKLRTFDLTISLLGPTSLVLFANVMATTISKIGDQNFIQRVQCTPTEKDARNAVITQLSVAVPLNVILFSLGTILFLFYRERPEMLNPTLRSDGMFPLFAAQNLPAGLAGLVVAALFAATMSTLSSAINSTANLGVEDFYRRLYSKASEKSCLLMSRIVSAALGVIGTLAALWLVNSDLRSVWDLAIMLTGMILAPIAGIFFLGIFTLRANSAGVITGAAASILATYLVKTYSPIHHFLYLPVGVITCVLFGYLVSIILPPANKTLAGLTVFTIYREKHD